MGRFLAGAASALLLATAGLFLWTSFARTDDRLPAAPPARSSPTLALSDPPTASDTTREAKRFSRYDHDRDGAVDREEFLLARRKGFAKLDVDHDGKLSFDEYAVKTIGKFAGADKDRSGKLDAAEFATTRIIRKTPARCACGPAEKDED